MNYAGRLGLAAIVIGLAGCGNTSVTDTWKDTNAEPKPLTKIVVVGLIDDKVTKHIFEDTFSKALRDRGNDATPAYTVVDCGPNTNPDSLVAQLRAAGFQAGLTARSLGEEMVETQTMGTSYYMPESYYHWGSYYSMSYGAVMSNSYTERSERVVVEANLFDLTSERLLWAARSKTTKTGKVKEGVNDYTRTIIPELAKSGWIK
jgi:hypothetical protein